MNLVHSRFKPNPNPNSLESAKMLRCAQTQCTLREGVFAVHN